MNPVMSKQRLPLCSKESCPCFDGKRCSLTGAGAGTLCEPAMTEIITAARVAVRARGSGAALDAALELLEKTAVLQILD